MYVKSVTLYPLVMKSYVSRLQVMGYTGCFIPLAVLTLLSTVVSVQVLPGKGKGKGTLYVFIDIHQYLLTITITMTHY